MKNRAKLILIGGFLGAGKTSLMNRAASLLKQKGAAVGLITNDQAQDLMDTALLKKENHIVYEVSGSCFCCNFDGLADAVLQIREALNGGIVLAEPVGSCTDLSATILQPVKDRYADVMDPAPLSVLADPQRLTGILDGVYSTASYIVTKQFDEADIILINKADLLTREQRQNLLERTQKRWPQAEVRLISVKTGEGVESWLDKILSSADAGTHLAEVDYDVYAAGEAAYGWLNGTWSISSDTVAEEKDARRFLEELTRRFEEQQIAIGHVKFLLTSGSLCWEGHLTGAADTGTFAVLGSNTLRTDGKEAEAEDGICLTVNARAETDPMCLKRVTEDAYAAVFSDKDTIGVTLRCLIPGRPNPTYRYRASV